MQDLRMSQTARRITGWADVLGLAGLGMAGIVFADNNEWVRATIAWGLMAFMFYFLGTAAYRLSVKGDGRIEVHYLLGLRAVSLGSGYTVKQGLGVRILRAGGKRFRINPGLGGTRSIESWLSAVQSGKTTSGNG